MCGSQLFVCTMFARLKTHWPNCVIAAACLPSGHRYQIVWVGPIDTNKPPYQGGSIFLTHFLSGATHSVSSSKLFVQSYCVPKRHIQFLNSKYHKYCSSKSKKLYLKSKVFQQKDIFLNIFAHLFFLNYEYCTCTKFLKIKNLLLYKKITIIHI